MNVKLVIIESPYKGRTPEDLDRNKRYLRSCIRDCIDRSESPYASHRMLTDALDDDDPVERTLGIEAGLAWRQACVLDGSKLVVASRVLPIFYLDLGWSFGMRLAKKCYDEEGITYEERKLLVDDPFFTAPISLPEPTDRYEGKVRPWNFRCETCGATAYMANGEELVHMCPR